MPPSHAWMDVFLSSRVTNITVGFDNGPFCTCSSTLSCVQLHECGSMLDSCVCVACRVFHRAKKRKVHVFEQLEVLLPITTNWRPGLFSSSPSIITTAVGCE